MEKILIIEGDINLANQIKENIISYFDFAFEIDVCHGKEEAKKIILNDNYFLAIVNYEINNEKKGESINYATYHQVPTLAIVKNLNKKIIKRLNDLSIIDYIIKPKISNPKELNSIIERIHKNKRYKALIVADSFTHRKNIELLLKHQLIDSLQTDNPTEINKVIRENKIKILFIDYHLYQIKGTEIIESLRKTYSKEELIILATPSSDEKNSAEFLKLGANDYISHDASKEETVSRINNNLEASENIEKMTGLANKDFLTNLSNRRDFYEKIQSLSYTKDVTTFSISMMDIDNFKVLNDKYGHETGDKAIKKVADIIRNNTKNSDVVSRFGGDEFCLFLKNIDEKSNEKLLNKIKKEIKENVLWVDEMIAEYTISIGSVIASNDYLRNINDIIKIADDNLYISKEKGKNEITMSILDKIETQQINKTIICHSSDSDDSECTTIGKDNIDLNNIELSLKEKQKKKQED